MFNNCDILHCYYKSDLGGKINFICCSYSNDIITIRNNNISIFKHFLYQNKKHFQLYLLYRIKYWHYVLHNSTVHLYVWTHTEILYWHCHTIYIVRKSVYVLMINMQWLSIVDRHFLNVLCFVMPFKSTHISNLKHLM